MMKIELVGARARVRARFSGEGSVKAETVATRCERIDCELLIDSEAPPEDVDRLVRVSEAGCFVIQSLREPVELRLRAKLNDRDLPPFGRSPGMS
jgi:hypothetical protein